MFFSLTLSPKQTLKHTTMSKLKQTSPKRRTTVKPPTPSPPNVVLLGSKSTFQTSKSLLDLFAGKSQLFVCPFKLGPDWKEGSFWAVIYRLHWCEKLISRAKNRRGWAGNSIGFLPRRTMITSLLRYLEPSN
jgi:hypothetical protein